MNDVIKAANLGSSQDSDELVLGVNLGILENIPHLSGVIIGEASIHLGRNVNETSLDEPSGGSFILSHFFIQVVASIFPISFYGCLCRPQPTFSSL